MIYRKNIYRWEQWSRVVLGCAVAAWGIGVAGGLVGYGLAAAGLGLAAAGLGLAATGVFGWCPACAMVGRRLGDR